MEDTESKLMIQPLKLFEQIKEAMLEELKADESFKGVIVDTVWVKLWTEKIITHPDETWELSDEEDAKVLKAFDTIYNSMCNMLINALETIKCERIS